jgi:cysteine sulfinate desulfinase/cysteine desulfurase-like protein
VAQSQKVLAEGILKEVPSAKLHGSKLGLERSPNHLAFSFAGLEAESLALVLDRVGLSVRGGSGCVTREMRIPPGMKGIGASPEESRALILFTLGPEIDLGKISKAVDLVKEAVQRLTSILPS